MTKVHGKRYAYKFDFHGLMMACQTQAGITLEMSPSSRGTSANCHPHHSHHLYPTGPSSSSVSAPPPPPAPPPHPSHYCWPYHRYSPPA